jgi:hypothetical protein
VHDREASAFRDERKCAHAEVRGDDQLIVVVVTPSLPAKVADHANWFAIQPN